MPKETYDDLIFQLGDLAREHLADSPKAPPSMQAVFDAEDVVIAARDKLAAIEKKLNAADKTHQQFLIDREQETVRLELTVKRFRSAVMGVEGRSRDLKKKISTQKATLRYQKLGFKKSEERHKELELREGHDVRKITLSQDNLKKTRLALMRLRRNIEEMEFEFKQVLTPRPGQQGAQGILAHKRLLEMDDDIEDEKASFQGAMEDFDQALHAQEEAVKHVEEDLDIAIFELGEAVYAERIPNSALNPVYAKLDKA